MKILNVNHLIAILKEVRDEHGLDASVEFHTALGRKSLGNISVKVVTVHDYTDETLEKTPSEKKVIITLV